MPHIAAIQLASGPNVSANLSETERLIDSAVASGAKLIVLPENFAMMGMSDQDHLRIAETSGQGPIQAFLSQQAKRHGIWLVGGTVPIKGDNPMKVRAACLLFDDSGQCAARYDKNHLFDVSLKEGTEVYAESMTFELGNEVVVADTPFGKLGIAVCYDLRFPELFRCMLDKGVEIIVLPAAFTAITGQAHWEMLVRARAIENLCYVIAAAQGGYHVSGRQTHGDSMIVDPWGVILDRLPHGAGFVRADLDRERLINIRRNFPAIEHRRFACALNKQVI